MTRIADAVSYTHLDVYKRQVDELAEKARAHAGRLKVADHAAIRGGAGAHIFEDLLHLDDVALEPGDLGDAGDLALAVRHARKLDDDADRRRDLPADGCHRHRQTGHADHLLQAGDGITRRVGVDGRHRPFMAGIHGLQHVEGFLAAALAENDAIGTHAQRVLDELTLADLALALDVRRPRLHAPDMGLLQLQLGGILDGEQPLPLRDEGGEGVEHGGLARAGAARNDGGDARAHRRRQHLRHRRTQRAHVHELVQVERLLGEFADRDQRTIDADRPDSHVDA